MAPFAERLREHYREMGGGRDVSPFPFTEELAAEYAELVGGDTSPLVCNDYVGYFAVRIGGAVVSFACVNDELDGLFEVEPLEDVDGYPLGERWCRYEG
jgi:hypothetical protein